MIIRNGDKTIQVVSIISDLMKRNGKTYPALRFEFENEATFEDIEVLLSGGFEILNDEGEVMGIHEGYNTLKNISVVVGKITTAEQQIEELEEVNAELQNAIDVIVGGGVEPEVEEGGNA